MSSSVMESQLCQNFHRECMAAINRMVNLELYASYVYLSMSYYFDRDDVALRHMAQFQREQSRKEREHAEKFLKYQNRRGGRIILQDIKKPERDEWGNGQEALECALQLEKTLNQALLDMHKLATEQNDPHVSMSGTAWHSTLHCTETGPGPQWSYADLTSDVKSDDLVHNWSKTEIFCQ
uniref:Ferritin n=1 Tax=Gopherus evgoodei TaxID=1825980 RepID=A0A8C4WL69_9SAUR